MPNLQTNHLTNDSNIVNKALHALTLLESEDQEKVIEYIDALVKSKELLYDNE